MDRIPKLAFLRKTLQQANVLHVIIDLEVRCAVHLKFQVLITYLILPEILCLSIEAEKKNEYKAEWNNGKLFYPEKGLVEFVHVRFISCTFSISVSFTVPADHSGNITLQIQ